ncbi:hypothetical protein BS78_07G082600 [Paspalum vaginatum]|nr:hypothetical protein BS78_07G082600 [Paspalum vaginatum]
MPAGAAGEERQQRQQETTTTTTQVGDLPEACLAQAIARTSPRDACRCTAVSRAFRAAAYSDHVWARFVPDDLDPLVDVPQSSAAAPKSSSKKKKDAYLALCHSAGAVTVGGGWCRVWLEKDTGARCYALSARSLSLPWDDGELSWKFKPHPRSRFAEMAELVGCTEPDIYGRLPAAAITPSTPNAAYLVYGTAGVHRSLSFPDQETAVAVGGRLPAERHAVCLCPEDDGDANETRSFRGGGGLR